MALTVRNDSSGTLTLAAGILEAVLTVIPVDDTLFEGAEAVTLTAGAGVQATVPARVRRPWRSPRG